MPRRRAIPTAPIGRFPEDFPDRLERLKEASGFSWHELARRMGAETRTVRRWRNGHCPTAEHLFNLFLVGSDVPGGLDIILGLGGKNDS